MGDLRGVRNITQEELNLRKNPRFYQAAARVGPSLRPAQMYQPGVAGMWAPRAMTAEELWAVKQQLAAEQGEDLEPLALGSSRTLRSRATRRQAPSLAALRIL